MALLFLSLVGEEGSAVSAAFRGMVGVGGRLSMSDIKGARGGVKSRFPASLRGKSERVGVEGLSARYANGSEGPKLFLKAAGVPVRSSRSLLHVTAAEVGDLGDEVDTGLVLGEEGGVISMRGEGGLGFAP